MGKVCEVEGCERKHKGKGYCEPHYRRYKKYGSPFGATKFKQKAVEYKVKSNGCYECTSHARNHKGYPTKKVGGLSKFISRIIYEECFGEIPEGHLVRHKCDNTSCINPEHLETGTHQDNMDDKVKRGRTYKPIGTENPKCKLNEGQVYEIRQLKREGYSYSELAQKYSISSNSVYRIVKRKQWGHV